MRYSLSGFTDLVNANFPDNDDQEIDADATNEVAKAFLDSFMRKDAPVEVYPFSLILSDLDSNLQITINHDLGSTNLKVVMFDYNRVRLFNRHYEAGITDADNVLLTIFSGIPFKKVCHGFIYVIA